MRPPLRLERWLAASLPDDSASGRSMLGDLAEEFGQVAQEHGRGRAVAWYLWQSIAIAARYRVASARAGLAAFGSGAALDARSSIRALRRAPGLVAVAIGSLAGGVGLTTAAVSLVYAVWFAPLPWPDAQRLVDLEDTHPVEVCAGCSPGTSYDAWLDWKSLPVFETSVALWSGARVLGDGVSGRRVEVGAMAGDGFGVFDLPVALGRGWSPDDTGAGEPVAVLSHALWTSAFGADPGIVGRTVRLDDTPHTVIGVLDESARALDRSRIWVPFDADVVERGYAARGVWVVARLAEGVSVEAAQAAVAEVAAARFAGDPTLEPGWSARVTPLRDVLVRSAAQPAAAAALIATALVVLLITALNLTALLVARVNEREAEFGLRSALGAGRLRVARAAVLEALLLAVCGGAVGVWAAFVVSSGLLRRFGSDLPGWVLVDLDLRIASIALALVVGTALATALLPFARASDAGRHLGLSGRLVRTGRPARLLTHDVLLALQVALGVVLVAGSLSALRTYARVSDFDTLGHRWQGIDRLTVTLPSEAPLDAVTRLRSSLARDPGTERVAIARSVFLGSWGRADAASPVWVDGQPEPVPNSVVPRHSLAVSADYFDLYEIPIVAGRPVDDSDRRGGAGAAVVSESAARIMWPGAAPADALASTFSVRAGADRTAYTVVGVAADVVVNPGSESRRAGPRIYLALAQSPEALFDASPESALTVHVVGRDTESGLTRGREEWTEFVDRAVAGAAVTDITTVEAVLRRWIGPARITGWALAGLGALSLALLAMGVFGTVSYRMSSSRRELGIRVALGARPAGLVHGSLGGLGRAVAAALGVGLVGAWFVGRGAVGGVPLGADDAGIMLAVAAVLVLVALASAVVPVRRALAHDPVKSLRAE